MVNPDSYPVAAANVVGKLINSSPSGRLEAVLVLPSQGKIEVLNEIGARIWSVSDGTSTINEIINMICAEYSIDPDVARKDVLEFIEKLCQKGIIELKENPVHV